MSKIFFSSDHHFYHNNVIRYCGRPYDTVEEMNEDLIKRWNSVVSPEDTVYYLGDFSLAFRPVETITKRLNGKKFLVPGNHDFCHSYHKRSLKPDNRVQWIRKYEECGFHVTPEVIVNVWNEKLFKLCHLPYSEDWMEHDKYKYFRPKKETEHYLLCGHVHEKWKMLDNMINVGCDVWNYTPVSLEQIEELINGKR